ncbi:MAG: zinc ribbon domain-containing protein [Candidatus Odinarchaeota archaeon]
MSKPRFCGFCGENLAKYDPNAKFCMNCGQPVLATDVPPESARGVTSPRVTYGKPVYQRDSAYQPSYPSYYRPPRPRVESVPVSESLNIFLTRPREIGSVFEKTSWRTILLIVLGVFFIEIIAFEILLTKISLDLTPEFLDSLLGQGLVSPGAIDAEAFGNMFIGMLPVVVPIVYVGSNFVTALLLGFVAYILMAVLGIDREVRNFKIAMTAVAFAFLPLLVFGTLQVVFAIIYPPETITVTSSADIDLLFEPTLVFNNIWLLLGLEVIFGIASSVCFFWAISKGMKLENNKTLVITIGYGIAYYILFTGVVGTLLYLLTGL